MRLILVATLLLTALPLVAEAQNTVTYVQPAHADPNAWRRNDHYMGNANRRIGNAGVSSRNRFDGNDAARFGRYRNGNARIVTQSNNNQNRNNSQTNGVTITNIYSVPSSVTNTAGSSATTTGTTTSGATTTGNATGNARVTTP